jgi:hypothetical protein
VALDGVHETGPVDGEDAVDRQPVLAARDRVGLVVGEVGRGDQQDRLADGGVFDRVYRR